MRRFITAGAALALAVTGLVAGAPKALGVTYSVVCTNNYPADSTEMTLVNTVVHIGTQRHTSGGRYSFTVCYSDTPSSSPSTLMGGYVTVTAHQVTPNQWNVAVECRGDSPTMLATVNCDAVVTTVTTTTTSTSPPNAGASVSGWTLVNGSTLTLGTTGANTGTLVTRTTGNPEVTYGGTCGSVAGITPVGCSTLVDADVATGDVTPGTVTGSTSTCLVTTGPTCHIYLPKAGVAFFRDAANPTQVTVLGTPVSDPGYTCIDIC